MVGVSYIIWKIFESTFRNQFGLFVCLSGCLSVCLYHDLQTNSCTSFLSWIIDGIHQWILPGELYKLMERFFLNLKFHFWIIVWKPKNMQTNSEVWILMKVQCVWWKCINRSVSTCSTNEWKAFSKFWNNFCWINYIF